MEEYEGMEMPADCACTLHIIRFFKLFGLEKIDKNYAKEVIYHPRNV